jgi:hypothetical protein
MILFNRNPNITEKAISKKNKRIENVFKRKIRKKLLFKLNPNQLNIFVKVQSAISLNKSPFLEKLFFLPKLKQKFKQEKQKIMRKLLINFFLSKL